MNYVRTNLKQTLLFSDMNKRTQKVEIGHSRTFLCLVCSEVYRLNLMPETRNRLFCFFGSTIGNLDRTEMKKFVKLLGAEMQTGDSLLLGMGMGMGMVKSSTIMEKAYNDDQKITADFNKNILNVINNLADTNFDPADFEHLAFYNEEKNRIEMHLKARKDRVISFNSEAGAIHIKKGETIHTENSHKFNKDDIETIGSWAGLDIEEIFMDDRKWFSLVHYKKNK